MRLEIFDVEHGACSLLTGDDGKKILIDCGNKPGWNPGDFLVARGISSLDMLVITNYDEDHVSGLPNLRQKMTDIQWLARNLSVDSDDLRSLKSQNGMGLGITELSSMMSGYGSGGTGGSQFSMDNVSIECFNLNYPNQANDENNLSLVTHISMHGINFLFPGDIEKSGWQLLLNQNPRLQQLVGNLHVLVASHHGRENGYYEELFTIHRCNPFWIVISDKGIMHDTQSTTNKYFSHAKGATFRGNNRSVLTTRKDGTIIFNFSSSSWYPQ